MGQRNDIGTRLRKRFVAPRIDLWPCASLPSRLELGNQARLLELRDSAQHLAEGLFVKLEGIPGPDQAMYSTQVSSTMTTSAGNQ
jgi:hypothetical protein